MKEEVKNKAKIDALKIIYEHLYIGCDYETSKKHCVVTIRNIIKETLEEYTNDENHDRVLHYEYVLEIVENLQKVFFIKTPILSENHFINNVGCLRYSYDNGRQSSVVEPPQIGEYLENEKHIITSFFVFHDKKIIVVETKSNQSNHERKH